MHALNFFPRTVGMDYVDPAYIAPRNGAKPVKPRRDAIDSFAGEENRRHSPTNDTNSMLWVPGNGNGQKLRAEPYNGNGEDSL